MLIPREEIANCRDGYDEGEGSQSDPPLEFKRCSVGGSTNQLETIDDQGDDQKVGSVKMKTSDEATQIDLIDNILNAAVRVVGARRIGQR